MAFTTTSDLKLTATDIITEALELIGVLAEGEAPSAAQTTSSLRTLNNLIKLWSADTQIFAQGEYRLQLAADTQEYSLSVSNVGYIPNKILNATLINAAFYDSPNYTLIYDNLAVSTYTVGETVTFSGGSTGVVATDDGATTMTIRITEGDAVPANDETMTGGTSGTTSDVNGTPAALAQTGASEEIPLSPLTQEEWYSLTEKKSGGRPTQYYYKRNPVEVAGSLKVWPVPEDTTYDMMLWIQYPYRDMDAGTDDVWFTQEWYMALSFELAFLLAHKYGIDPRERRFIKDSADEYYAVAASYDVDGSVFLQPASRNG
jgi:hypothetical protein